VDTETSDNTDSEPAVPPYRKPPQYSSATTRRVRVRESTRDVFEDDDIGGFVRTMPTHSGSSLHFDPHGPPRRAPSGSTLLEPDFDFKQGYTRQPPIFWK
jgi:hypothetical protein